MRLPSAVASGVLVALVSACGGAVTPPKRVKAPAKSTPPALGSLDSSGAGHRFYEIYEPAGAVRGTMLVIHGGGWKDSRGDARTDMASAALAMRAEGWRVLDISYSPGYKPAGTPLDPDPMLRDVVAFYDQIRQAYGDPICAYGQSAGAHLAAMLAVERPSLRCAILDAGPLDLPTLAKETDSAGRKLIRNTFGSDPVTLARWSPARDWRATIRTAVWATFAAGDPVVPPQQGDIFHAADAGSDVGVVPTGSFHWLHSNVDYGTLFSRDITSLFKWLDRIAPVKAHSPVAPGTDVGDGCDTMPAPGQRFKLMLAGDAWQELPSAGLEPIAATRGCSGAADYQDDGLSLWALPGTGTLPAGQTAQLVLDPDRIMSRLSVSFRGFLARPREWRLGLYASTRSQGPIAIPVATCDRGACMGLGLFGTSFGSLVTASGSKRDPDASGLAPSATFTLPAGTRRIAWQLACVASSGCSLAGIGDARLRDPLGQPAIFSLYRVQVS